MELYFKYLEGVQQADKRIEGEKHVGISLFSLFSLQPWQSFPSSLCFLLKLQINFIQIFLVEHRWIIVIHSPKQIENWNSVVITNYSHHVHECANQVQQPYFFMFSVASYLFEYLFVSMKYPIIFILAFIISDNNSKNENEERKL